MTEITVGGRAAGTSARSLVCIVLAHADPVHVRRLIAALDPFPVVLHCDARTPLGDFNEMTAGFGDRCIPVTPRRPTGWAQWDLVAAEIAAYRLALEVPGAQHVALMAGSDYPLASTSDIARFLADYAGKSIGYYALMPIPGWGRSGGLARLRYRHWAWRKRMLRLPVPRRLPADVVPAGGAQQKVLSRQHVAQLVRIVDTRPDLVRFWRHSWIADETFVPTLLRSPRLGINWEDEHVEGGVWWIGWDGKPRKSPPWLDDMSYLDWLRVGREGSDESLPKIFARKFSTDRSTELLDRIDSELRAKPMFR